MGIFDTPTETIPTKEQEIAAQIDAHIIGAGMVVLKAYMDIRRLIFNNPNFTDSNDAVSAFLANTKTNLSAADLVQLAEIAKTGINFLQSEKIQDDISSIRLNKKNDYEVLDTTGINA